MSNSTPTPEAIEALALELRGHEYKPMSDVAAWILSRFVRREEHERVVADEQANCDKHKRRQNRLVEQARTEGRKHLDLLLEDNARLRAELRGQRCDGSGWLWTTKLPRRACPSCPACKPEATPQAKCECGHVREQHTQGCRVIGCDCPYYAPPDATPKGDGGRWAKAIAAADPGRDDFDGGRTPESVMDADKQLSTGAPAQVTGASGQSESTAASSKAASAAPVPPWQPHEWLPKSPAEAQVKAQLERLRRENDELRAQPTVVKLHPETLRALVAAILNRGAWQDDAAFGTRAADVLLTHLREKETL